jgi:MFS family permease
LLFVRSALASGRLRRIVVAYTVNRLGTWMGLVALLVAVYDHTHSAPAVAALLLCAQAVPALLVPALVARVEASERRSELSALYFFEALATAALAVLLWHFWLPGVLLLAGLDGTAALAAQALLRSEVARAGREELGDAGGGERSANAALNFAFSATFVTGPIVGGAIVASAGPPAALFVDVGSFLICGALLLDLHPHVEEAGADSVAARLRTAWRHVREAPTLRGLLLVEAVAWVFIESGGPIEVALAKATLHAGDRGFGLILTTWGGGAVIGALIFARSLRQPLGALLLAGPLGIGLGYAGFAVAPTLALACVAALIGGIGNGIQWAALFSAIQRLTPPPLHGRLMGGVESLAALCLAAGLGLGGGLVALSSPRIAFLTTGLGAIAAGLGLLRLPLWQLGTRAETEVPASAAAQPHPANGQPLAQDVAVQQPARH